MPAAVAPPAPPPALSALDWIAVGLTGLLAVFLLLWPWGPAPAFRAAFAELGGELPRLTALTLSAWLAPALAAIPTALILLALLPRGAAGIGGRRALVALAFFVALAGVGLCFVGAYLPIFNLAGAIR